MRRRITPEAGPRTPRVCPSRSLIYQTTTESDGGAHNIRVFQNRGVNAAHNGYSAQPMFGGPVYFFRNLLYHVPGGGAVKVQRRTRRQAVITFIIRWISTSFYR